MQACPPRVRAPLWIQQPPKALLFPLLFCSVPRLLPASKGVGGERTGEGVLQVLPQRRLDQQPGLGPLPRK